MYIIINPAFCLFILLQNVPLIFSWSFQLFMGQKYTSAKSLVIFIVTVVHATSCQFYFQQRNLWWYFLGRSYDHNLGTFIQLFIGFDYCSSFLCSTLKQVHRFALDHLRFHFVGFTCHYLFVKLHMLLKSFLCTANDAFNISGFVYWVVHKILELSRRAWYLIVCEVPEFV